MSVARNTADDLTCSEGRVVTLEEDADLQLPFLLPEDGYSSDIIKGIPQGNTVCSYLPRHWSVREDNSYFLC